MSEQIWIVEEAQNLKPGDLIPNLAQTCALEVKRVKVDGAMVLVDCYIDRYYQYDLRRYCMFSGQHIPVAASGVSHMDAITVRKITPSEEE